MEAVVQKSMKANLDGLNPAALEILKTAVLLPTGTFEHFNPQFF